MSVFTPAANSMHATTRPVVAVRVIGTVSSWLRALRNRRAFYRLGDMSDAELADIGLTRADLDGAVDLPFGSDPTSHLGAMAQARRIESLARLAA